MRKLLSKGTVFSIVCILFFTFLTSNLVAQNSAIVTQNICKGRKAKKIEKVIQKVNQDWKIPGLTYALMRRGKVILAGGVGVKNLDLIDSTDASYNNKVDYNTVYQIGSVSKSFTATLLAIMVDKGMLSWNDKVKEILPEFDLKNDEYEADMNISDLCSHMLGFPHQAGTYIPNLGYDRNDVLKLLKDIDQPNVMGEDFAYSNIAFDIAAAVIEKVSNDTYENILSKYLLLPIGMNGSSVNAQGFLNSKNRSEPYTFGYGNENINDSVNQEKSVIDSIICHIKTPELITGSDRALHWETAIAPAGGINAPAIDLVKWAEFHRRGGKVKSRRLVSQDQMNFLHTPNHDLGYEDSFHKEYAKGDWYIETHHRYHIIYHTGTTWGFTTLCFYIPEYKISMAILSNSEASKYSRFTIMREVARVYGDKSKEDWRSYYLEKWYQESKKDYEKDNQKKLNRIYKLSSNLSSNLFIGGYLKDGVWGEAYVTKSNDSLFINVGKYLWKHYLEPISNIGNDSTQYISTEYKFSSNGHTFPLQFIFNKDSTAVEGFEIDFHYHENVGPWMKVASETGLPRNCAVGDTVSLTVKRGVEDIADRHEAYKGEVLTLDGPKPLIGISSVDREGLASVNQTYVNAVRRAGGIPVVIPIMVDSLSIDALLDKLDGVIMTGGPDVNPQIYHEKALPELGSVSLKRDAFDAMLLRMAVRKGKVVMGTCRGMQLMNIVFGGTLYQDIPSQIPTSKVKHSQKKPTYLPNHTIMIDRNSLLYRQIGRAQIKVNSFHHQAVKDVAPGFKVTAYASDGVPEAFEMIGNPRVFGVQFHPEGFTSYGQDQFIGIYKYLIKQAISH
ncbi:MAG: gamma-glutamyl-gamma-aminobutyrate hydrolase family protein [Bacteroidales bacterium]